MKKASVKKTEKKEKAAAGKASVPSAFGGTRDRGSRRLFILGAAFVAALGIFTARAVKLGGDEAVFPGALAVSTQREVTVPALRGEIYDRSGKLLAGNEYSYALKFDPSACDSSDGALQELYMLLCEYGCDGKFASYDSFKEAVDTAGGKLLTLCDDTGMSMIAHVKNTRPAGLSVEKKLNRIYYYDTYTAHVLGHTGKIQQSTLEYYSELGYPMDATVGTDGAEAAFEEYLHGIDGSMIVTYDGYGNTVATEIVREPVAGQNVYLTIDVGLQQEAVRALESKISGIGAELADGEARGGAIVAADVRDGGLLVCASYPYYSYDAYKTALSELSADASAPLFNRAVNGRYAPGSVMKLATAAAALESGSITTDTVIEDKGVYDYYESFQPQCWLYVRDGRTHGEINVRQAIMHSCNYFFFETGRLTGISAMNDYAARLGLGEASGIEEGFRESAAVLAGPASRAAQGRYWGEGETLAAAIGQSDNLFTPTQLCAFISGIASGGTRYGMHLLLKVCDADGETVYSREPEVIGSAALSQSTLDAVRGGMYDAAHYGTVGGIFEGIPYSIAGKTGTAQISDEESNAVFAAYAPFDDPRIAVVCVIENGSDGFNAAYPARALLSGYFSSYR